MLPPTPLSHIAAAVTVTFAKRRRRRYTRQVGPPPAPSAVIRNTQFFPNLRKKNPAALPPPLLFPVFFPQSLFQGQLDECVPKGNENKTLVSLDEGDAKRFSSCQHTLQFGENREQFPFSPFLPLTYGKLMYVGRRKIRGTFCTKHTHAKLLRTRHGNPICVTAEGEQRMLLFLFCVSEQAGRGGVR